MSWVSNLFKQNEDPSKSANQYLDQIPGAMGQYYQPWIQSGDDARGQLTGQYGQMTNDPGALYSRLASGYQQSPGYQSKMNAALSASQNASAAGGMLGTPYDQTRAQQTASGIAGQDFNDYMNQIMGIYGAGQKGMQGQQDYGFRAGTGYADSMGQVLGQQGQNAYNAAAGRNAARGQNWANIMGLVGTGAGMLAGGK